MGGTGRGPARRPGGGASHPGVHRAAGQDVHRPGSPATPGAVRHGPRRIADDVARRAWPSWCPRARSIVFQMHYTPNGKAQKDRSSIGLIFAKKPPDEDGDHPAGLQRVLPHSAGGRQLRGALVVSPSPKDAQIIACMPHMHLRGKDFLIRAVYPDGNKTRRCCRCRASTSTGKRSTARSSRSRMPKGSKVDCMAHFDNSRKNPSNPDPDSDRLLGRPDLARDDDRLDGLRLRHPIGEEVSSGWWQRNH